MTPTTENHAGMIEFGKAGVSETETLSAEPGQSVVEPADRVKHPGTYPPDALGLCCCHGHLDGLTLDEMAALGAPCPTEAHVRERIAAALLDAAKALPDELGSRPTASALIRWLHARATRVLPPGSPAPSDPGDAAGHESGGA